MILIKTFNYIFGILLKTVWVAEPRRDTTKGNTVDALLNHRGKCHILGVLPLRKIQNFKLPANHIYSSNNSRHQSLHVNAATSQKVWGFVVHLYVSSQIPFKRYGLRISSSTKLGSILREQWYDLHASTVVQQNNSFAFRCILFNFVYINWLTWPSGPIDTLTPGQRTFVALPYALHWPTDRGEMPNTQKHISCLVAIIFLRDTEMEAISFCILKTTAIINKKQCTAEDLDVSSCSRFRAHSGMQRSMKKPTAVLWSK